MTPAENRIDVPSRSRFTWGRSIYLLHSADLLRSVTTPHLPYNFTEIDFLEPRENCSRLLFTMQIIRLHSRSKGLEPGGPSSDGVESPSRPHGKMQAADLADMRRMGKKQEFRVSSNWKKSATT